MIEMPTDAVTLHVGDCRKVLPSLGTLFDAVITDPPYGLEFMGKEWDSFAPGGKRPTFGKPDGTKFRQHHGTPSFGASGNPSCKNCGGDKYRNGERKCQCDSPDFGNHAGDHNRVFQEWCESWANAALRVLKPGGYMVSFGGSRTHHRLMCAIEDAGFEIRDCLMWLYGTGFPKGQGCLKPAYEPIILARRPGPKVLLLGVDECRVPCERDTGRPRGTFPHSDDAWGNGRLTHTEGHPAGRYPANVVIDNSDEVTEAFAAFGESKSTGGSGPKSGKVGRVTFGDFAGDRVGQNAGGLGDTGTAARFFYCAKSSKSERGDGNTHPCVKPLALMRWLVRLVCPSGGTVLDPFAGSGTTGLACEAEGRRCVMIEENEQYAEIIRRRLCSSPLIEAR